MKVNHWLPEDEVDDEVLKEAIYFAISGDLDFHQRMGAALTNGPDS